MTKPNPEKQRHFLKNEKILKKEVSKASKIYEHGISLERNSKLPGITIYNIANCLGQTEISKAPLNPLFNLKKRVKILGGLFQ